MSKRIYEIWICAGCVFCNIERHECEYPRGGDYEVDPQSEPPEHCPLATIEGYLAGEYSREHLKGLMK